MERNLSSVELDTQIKIDMGNRLKEERERLDLTQDDLVSICKKFNLRGATRQGMGKYENGQHSMSAVTLWAIEQIGIDTYYIVTGKRGNLTARELNLIANYRRVSEASKKVIDSVSVALVDTKRKE